MKGYSRTNRIELSPASRLSSSYERADFADAFSVYLPAAASGNVETLARHVFAHQPKWIALLMRIRDILVRPFGLNSAADLKAKGGERINIFHVFEKYRDEIILGEDDTHLNFRVSVLLQSASKDGRDRLTITTIVFYNCLLGRAYIALIAPFHRLVVKTSLDRAQKCGWPTRDENCAMPQCNGLDDHQRHT